MRKKQRKNLNLSLDSTMSLKTQIISSFLCIGIIPLLIFSIISGLVLKSSMYNRELQSLRQISSLITENLDDWGEENLILAEDISNSPLLLDTNTDNIKSELKNKKGQNVNIRNILYIDASGNVIADSLGSMNINISNKSYFNGISSEFDYISDVITDEKTSTSFMVFSSPVRQNNTIIGYTVVEMDITDLKSKIGRLFYSDKGEVFTFNKDGFITYSTTDSSKIMNENIINSSSKDLSKAATKSLDGNFNSINYTLSGTSGVAVYNYIPSLNWGAIATTPNSEIYAGFFNVLWTSAPVVAVMVLLILVAAIAFLKLLITPISKIGLLTQEVAQGNLDITCELHGSREMNNIGNNLNEMVQALKTLVLSISNKNTELNDAAVILDELASSAEESSRDISKAMSEISGSAVSQASRTDGILTHVRNLDEKISELHTRIDETNQVLKASNVALTKGNNGTKELKTTTENQYDLVNKAVSQVNELSSFVSNIDEIIETIRDIAEQTSLLSLNASIEAARAGENGKGFAIVAEEVGLLANESQVATKKTAEMLNAIKIKANSTTDIMKLINDGMVLQTSTVNETISIFDEITESDNKISNNIKSFTTLFDFIKEFSDDLLELIESLASSSEETAAVSEEVTASSDEQISIVEKVKSSSDDILKIVEELKFNIEKFNIEG